MLPVPAGIALLLGNGKNKGKKVVTYPQLYLEYGCKYNREQRAENN